jgi:hypothetical protein
MNKEKLAEEYASISVGITNNAMYNGFIAGYDEATKWIPVSEKLPTRDDGDSEFGIVDICTFTGNHQPVRSHLHWHSVQFLGSGCYWQRRTKLPEKPYKIS